MNISVVGLGYVGTVSAACLASRGHHVWGVDISPEKVRLITEGYSPVVEKGLAEKIGDALRTRSLSATNDVEQALRETDLCFVAVATPSLPNGQVDPAQILCVCEEIGRALTKLGRRQVVVLRSSILPSVIDECHKLFDTFAPGRVTLCANPEFLREGTAVGDFEGPPFTLLGVQNQAAELMLRSVYEGFAAPILVLPIKEALLVKYASNAYHALKVAFANEIGALCQYNGIDGQAVMSMFCRDRKLNISTQYLMPGFAFGGSCLPKDIRAILYAAKQCDLELPVIGALFASNDNVIERAVRQVIAMGVRSVGLIGLSFKSATDDLRESPLVELAERLLGKGYELRIYDPNVSLAKLNGANKEYINLAIPHLSRLLVRSLDDLALCDGIVIGHNYPEVAEFVERTSAQVIDLTGRLMLPTPKALFLAR